MCYVLLSNNWIELGISKGKEAFGENKERLIVYLIDLPLEIISTVTFPSTQSNMDIQLNKVFVFSSSHSCISVEEKDNLSGLCWQIPGDLKERLMWLRAIVKSFTHFVYNNLSYFLTKLILYPRMFIALRFLEQRQC